MGLRCACSDKDCMDCIFLLDCQMYARMMLLTHSMDELIEEVRHK